MWQEQKWGMNYFTWKSLDYIVQLKYFLVFCTNWDQMKMYTYCSARNLTLTLKNSKINFYFNNFYNISTCISNLNILHSIISWYWNILKVYLFWRCLRRSLNLINKLDTNFNESIQIFLYIEYKKFDCLFIEQPQCWTEHDA